MREMPKRNEPQHQKMYLRTCAPSEDSNSLIRIFPGRILASQWCKGSSCGQRTLWSECEDAQADLSLRYAHMSEVIFSRLRLKYLHISLRYHTIRYCFTGSAVSRIVLKSSLSSWSHIRIASHKKDICKQCRLRSDAAERGVWSGSTLFAINSGISINHGNNKH